MTATSELERRLADWLDEDGPIAIPPLVVDAALARASSLSQRPAWSLREWWLPRRQRRVSEGPDASWADVPDAVPAIRLAGSSRRMAWVLAALLALLLLGGGLLTVGGWLPSVDPWAAGCPLGSNPDAAGPAGQARPAGIGVAEWAGDGQIVVLTGDGPPWTFDVCTNTWRPGAPADPSPTAQRAYPDPHGPWEGALAYDERSDTLAAFGAYGVTTRAADGTWTARGGRSAWGAQAGYDPAADRFIVRDIGSRQMWTYDLDANAWEPIEQLEPVPPTLEISGYQLTVYDPAARRFTLVDGSGMVHQTWQFDPVTRTWERTHGVAPIDLFIQTDELAYDTTRGRPVAYANGRVIAYDAAAEAWEVLFEAGPTDLSHQRGGAGVAYDRFNDRLVVFGGRIDNGLGDWVAADDVIAFDLEARTWVELLAPGEGGAP